MGIKDIILGYYDKYMYLKNNDVDIKSLLYNINSIKNGIQKAEKSCNSKLFLTLNNKLKVEEENYINKIKIELSQLYIQYPDMFQIIVVKETSRDILESVLTQYELFKNGKVSERDAIKTGINFTNNRFNLPNGFLDESKIDDFIQNKGKDYTEE